MNGSRGSSLNGTLQFLDEMPADYLGGLNQQLRLEYMKQLCSKRSYVHDRTVPQAGRG